VRFVDHIEFGATQNGVSLGRWPNGTGELFPMMARTLGSENAGPLPPSVVISELHYHPAAPSPEDPLTEEELEFVELFNPGPQPVDLSHWRLNRAVDFSFAADSILAAGQGTLVVSFDPIAEPSKAEAFRGYFDVPADVALHGPYQGVLDNGGENVELDRPEDPLQLGLGYVLVDRVRYDDATPWPPSADGLGDSLQRTAAEAYGNLAASWTAQLPTPGRAPLAGVPGDLNGDGQLDAVDIDTLSALIRSADPLADINGNGVIDEQDRQDFISGIFGTSYGDSNLDRIFDSNDMVFVFQKGEYEDGIPNNSTWASGDWNGDGEFDSNDFVAAFQTGRYEQPAAVNATHLAAAVDWIFFEQHSKGKRSQPPFVA
jgi:hypothetical protein